MSMTRDAYAKELLKAAQAAFSGNQVVLCPHENCTERLRVVRQSMFSTRSLFCPVHGHIFQEQRTEPFSKLDWDAAKQKFEEEFIEEEEWEEETAEEHPEEEYPGDEYVRDEYLN